MRLLKFLLYFFFLDCFKTTIKYGSFVAIFTTYLASTMLHGLNFQIGAVLLSLGFYTYVEHRLRSRLADIFGASLTAGRGRVFRHGEGSFPVIIANFLFGVLATFHLAYLGVMFNQDQSMSEGYSWRHTLSKWNELDFLSTKIMIGCGIFMMLIR